MEVTSEQSGEDTSEKPQNPEKVAYVNSLSEGVKKVAETGKPRAAVGLKGSTAATPLRKRVESRSVSDSTLGAKKSGLTCSSGGSTSSVSGIRGNRTGGLPEKPLTSEGRRNSISSTIRKKSSSSTGTEPVRRSLPELRRSSISSSLNKPSTRAGILETRKSLPASPVGRSLRTSIASDVSELDTAKKPLVRPASSVSSSSRKAPSSSLDSSSSTSARRTVSKLSSPSARSQSVSSTLRSGSLSSSQDRSSTLSGRRKGSTPESRDSRFIVLPQVEIKASDDVVSIILLGL